MSHAHSQFGELCHDYPVMAAPPSAPATVRSAFAVRQTGPVYRFGRCKLQVSRRELYVDDRLQMLQPRAFDLLLYLITHRDRVVRTDELLDNLWRSHVVQLGSLAAAVSRVRKAIGEEPSGLEPLIRTYPRVGYRFVATLKQAPEGC